MKFTKKQKTKVVSLVVILLLFFYSVLTSNTDFFPQIAWTPRPEVEKKQTILNETAVSTDSAEFVQVTRVIDGDTIEVNGDQTVRYIGIDTPETVDPRQGVQCFGQEASDKNKELVLNKTVRLKKDVSDTDRYGRLLRYVYVDDQMINELLVREGYAQASSYPPDVSYQNRLEDAEKLAREEGKGLWGSCR